MSMTETQDVSPESSQETEVAVETPIVSEDAQTPTEQDAPSTPKTEEKTVPYSRFKEVADKAKKLEAQVKQPETKALDIEEFLDISTSLEGLDQVQKEFLARQHKLTGEPLKKLRDSEDFKLWDSGYQVKVEKEKSLKPTGTQELTEKPISFSEALRGAKTLEERSELLKKAGFMKEEPLPKTRILRP